MAFRFCMEWVCCYYITEPLLLHKKKRHQDFIWICKSLMPASFTDLKPWSKYAAISSCFPFLRNATDTAISGALVFAGRHRILRSYKRCCAAFHLCLHQTDKISSGSVIPVMGRIVRHFSGLFHPSPDRPLAPELCITENNPLTVNRWMLYSFTLPGHPHLKLKYW